jgi:hypothetical protein
MIKKNLSEPREPHKNPVEKSKKSGNCQNKYRYHTAQKKTWQTTRKDGM